MYVYTSSFDVTGLWGQHFFFGGGGIYFSQKYEMANFFYKTCKKMENVNFIFNFFPSSYIRNLLEIAVKLKI